MYTSIPFIAVLTAAVSAAALPAENTIPATRQFSLKICSSDPTYNNQYISPQHVGAELDIAAVSPTPAPRFSSIGDGKIYYNEPTSSFPYHGGFFASKRIGQTLDPLYLGGADSLSANLKIENGKLLKDGESKWVVCKTAGTPGSPQIFPVVNWKIGSKILVPGSDCKDVEISLEYPKH